MIEFRLFFESSGFWSDKVFHLSLGLWRNVTQRDGEYGGISKQALIVTEAPLVRGATEIVCQFF